MVAGAATAMRGAYLNTEMLKGRHIAVVLIVINNNISHRATPLGRRALFASRIAARA
jgi:hypothetical protein